MVVRIGPKPELGDDVVDVALQTTFTGIQLVTETVPAGGNVNGTPLGEQVEAEASHAAVAAFASAVVGFLLSMLGVQRGPGWLAAAGFAALLALIWNAMSTMADVYFESGFTLALLLFLVLWLLYVTRWVRRVRAARRDTEQGAHAARDEVLDVLPRPQVESH
jgi:uncharacterized membrane protein YciS (DUF1049 family)